MAIVKRKRCVGCHAVLADYVDVKRGRCYACHEKRRTPHPWKKDR